MATNSRILVAVLTVIAGPMPLRNARGYPNQYVLYAIDKANEDQAWPML